MARLRLFLLVVGCAAPILWCAIILYAKFFTEGWGAFGVAPLFPPLFAADAAVAVLGGFLYLANFRKRPRDFTLIAVAAVNGLLYLSATLR